MKFIALIFCFTAFLAYGQEIGSWEDHLPYHNAVDLTHDDNHIITSAKAGIFYYSLKDNSLSKLSKADGLSDVSQWSENNHQHIEYHEALDLLFIAYTNGNIDLVKDGQVVNIPDIKNASIIGAKRINEVDLIGNFAYLSTTFGIVVINLEKHEVKDTYQVGPSDDNIVINDFAALEDTFFAATDNGLYRALADGTVNLLNFINWTQVQNNHLDSDNIPHVFNYENSLFTVQNDSLYKKNGNGWGLFYAEEEWQVINYSEGFNKLLLTMGRYTSNNFVPEESKVISLDGSGQSTVRVPTGKVTVPYQAIEYKEGQYWIADYYDGLYRYTAEGSGFIHPNGPGSARIFSMATAQGELYVASGGVSGSYNYFYIRDGFFTYGEQFWNSYNEYNYPILEEYLDMIDVVASEETGAAYFASFYGGVVKFDRGQITTWNKDNSALQAPAGDNARTSAAGLALDRNNNLWVANNKVARPLVVIAPDGQSYSYALPNNISTGTDVVIDDAGQKWVICDRNGSAGMAVYDDAGTLDNTTDDASKLITTANGNGSLHTNEVTCAAKDQDGAIWVGTEEGVTVFYCARSVLGNGCEASRPLIEQEGNFNYLLENEVINDIEIDGANRKWFATNNGAFLMNAEGEKQIEYFNASNSPLLSDVVRDIAINHQNGEVFFGTDNGIISYIGTAANEPQQGDECKVYPNPLRPEYEGVVTIDGVVPNANVKITDASGNLFYETQASGSRVTWDATNYDGERAKSGVYLVFISNPDGSETNVCKLLIVN